MKLVCSGWRVTQTEKMKTRKLGSSGLTVSAIGLGCMGMSDLYGPRYDAQSMDKLERALDVVLAADEVAPGGVAAGGRYPAALTGSSNR